MAQSVVSFLLTKLDTFLTKEAKLLSELRGQFREIKYELESIKSFLKDADAIEEMDERAKTWVTQVRDVAHDIEDLLDEFTLRLHQHSHGHGHSASLYKTACDIKKWKVRRWMASKIVEIRTRVLEISKRKDQYGFDKLEEGATSHSTSENWHDPRVLSLFIEEADLVGIDQPKHELSDLLMGGESRLKVISVVGMGGLGKTTLVKKVYETVKDRFQCYAWVNVTRLFKIEEIIRSMVKKFVAARKDQVPKGIDSMQREELMEILHDYLRQNRYVIVFDDIWSINAWISLKCALPDNNCGSRIMVTTRIYDVASSCIETYGHIYKLQPLSAEEAWTLFCRKAFGTHDQNCCPPELQKLAQDILLRCRGLPLAIVALGSLLFKKNKNMVEWEMVHRSLGLELECSDGLKSVNKILSLSYNDLPYYLKHCFLYFSNFPENYLVKRMKLIRLWIAEGFVEEKVGRTVEEIAEGYLNDLISRNLIQVAEMHDSGTVRTCGVHDLLREIIVSKSREEKFSTSTTDPNNVSLENVRRLTILIKEENSPPSRVSSSHLRSLFIFGGGRFSNSSLASFLSSFRLLRVLDLENSNVEIFPEELGHLFLLRYLSLKNTRVTVIPKCLGKLKNLETLNLKGTWVQELPEEVVELQHLRHFLVYHHGIGYDRPFECTYGVKVPARIGTLRSLQNLLFIEANGEEGIARAVGNLTQLTRLGITKLRREDGMDLCSSIEKMNHLCSLSAMSMDEEELLDLQSISTPPSLLRYLFLVGRLEKLPDWITSLGNLVRLHLRYSGLKQDPFKSLQNLPKLVNLRLTKAFHGEELCCRAGGFQALKKLYLRKLSGLKTVRVETGGMPELQELGIAYCSRLEKMEHPSHLQTLYLLDIPVEYGEKIISDECAPNIFCSYTLKKSAEAFNMELEEFPVEYREKIIDDRRIVDVRSHHARSGGFSIVEPMKVDARLG